MPVVNLQDQSLATLRKKYIAKVKSADVAPQVKSTAIARANTLTKAQLVSELGAAMKQQVKQQVKAQVKSQKAKSQKQARTSAKSQKAKARGTRKSAKGGRKTAGGAARLIKIPKLLRSRVGKIMRAIKAGTVAVKQGKDTPSKYALSDARDRYTAFANLYKDERITRKSRKSRKSKKTRKSIKAVFAQVQGQKFPYMLKKGYRVPARVVGGGARGAGIIRAVPGSGAPAFSTLSDAEQAKVVAFLNANGKKLRGKGAGTKTVNLQAIKRQATAETQRRKSQKAARKSRKSIKGAANRR